MSFRNRWCLVTVLAAMLAVGTAYGAAAISDDFESYAVGSGLKGIGIWDTWDGSGPDGVISDEQAASGTKSLKIVGDNDVTANIAQAAGMWEIKCKVFVPAGHAGTTYFILMNAYDGAAGGNDHWAQQFELRDTSVAAASEGGGTAPLVVGAWSEIKVVVDLFNNVQSVYYNDALLLSNAEWAETTSARTLGIIDFYGAGGSSAVYFDDLAVTEIAPPISTGWTGTESGVGSRFSDEEGFRGASNALDGFEPGMVVSGSGGDIWGDWDSFYYVYNNDVKVVGDFDASVQIMSFTKADGVSGNCWWARAGFMVRDNVGNGSPYAFVGVNGGRELLSYSRQDNGTNFWGDTGYPESNPGPQALPLWMRMTRVGNTYTFFWKQNEGDAWTQLRQHPRTWSPTAMLLGFGVQNHNDCYGDLPALGKFARLSITDATGPVVVDTLAPVGVYGAECRTMPTGVYARWNATGNPAYFIAERYQNGATETLTLPGDMREVIDNSAAIGYVTYKLTPYTADNVAGGSATFSLWTNGITSSGYVTSWAITPHLNQPWSWWPSVANGNRDVLAEGGNGPLNESNILPVPGTQINPEFNGAASTSGCQCGWKRGCSCGPVTFMYAANQGDGFLDFSDIFQDINDVVTVMVCYATNNTGADAALLFETNSDDSIFIMIDNTVWSVYQGCCYGTGLGILPPGEHRVYCKVFEGGGGHNARVRILKPDWSTYAADAITFSTYPKTMTTVPAAIAPSAGMELDGTIVDWLVIAQYRQPYSSGPSYAQMAQDFLTEGANGPKTEENIVPVAGMTVMTDYAAAASDSCARGTNPSATCDPVTVLAVQTGSFDTFADRGRVNFTNVFAEDTNDVMAYMVCYVTNNTAENVFCLVGSGSDDSIQIKLDNVIVQSVTMPRGYTKNQDSALMVVTPGTHRLMLKVFEGGGGFDGGASLKDWATRGPLTPGVLTISLTPPDGFVVPPPPPLACITDLAAAKGAEGVTLSWANAQAYAGFLVERKAALANSWTILADNVAGDATSFVDATPDTAAPAVYYRVSPYVFITERNAYVGVCSPVVGLTHPAYAVYQEGMFPTPEYTGTQDSHIIVNTPNSNQGASPLFEEGDWNAPTGYDHKEGLLGFAIDALPQYKKLQSATMGVFFDSSRNGVYNDHTVYIRQVMKAWNQGTGCCSDGPAALDGEVSWNAARQGEETWEIPGAYGPSDISAPSPEVSAVFGAASQSWVTFGGEGLSNLVNTWLLGVFENFGMKVTQCVDSCPTEPNTYVNGAYDFCTSENSDVTRRPILILLIDRAPTVSVTPAGPVAVELCHASVDVALAATVADADRDAITTTWTTTGGTVTPGTPATTATATFTEVGQYVVTCTASDGALSRSVDVVIDVGVCTNTAPTISLDPAGPVSLDLCVSPATQAFTATVADIDVGQTLTTTWESTGGTITGSGTSVSVAFDAAGEFDVTATVTDGIATASATAHVVVGPCPGAPVYTGDANDSGAIDIADAICILGYLFGPTGDACKQPKCLANMDTNDSDVVDIADAIRVLSFLFANGDMVAPDTSTIVAGGDGCNLYVGVTLECANPCNAK